MSSERGHFRVCLVRTRGDPSRTSAYPRNPRPPHLLKYQQACLSRVPGVAVSIVDAWLMEGPDRALAAVLEQRPHLLVITGTSPDRAASLRLARQVRAVVGSCRIVGAGQDPSCSPGTYLSGGVFDLVLRGESELLLERVVRSLLDGEDPSGWPEVCSPEGPDGELAIVSSPDLLPRPSFTRREMEAYRLLYPLPTSGRVRWGHLLTSRGCPHHCGFCSQVIRESYGAELRTHGAARVADDMAALGRAGATVFALDDDDFTASRQHVEAVCREIIHRNLGPLWSAHGRVDEVDRGLLELMARAGCVQLRFGVETGSARVLRSLGKPSRSGGWADLARLAFRSCRELGICTVGLFMIGCPGETRADVEETIRLARELEPDLVQFSYFTVYPGSTFSRAGGREVTGDQEGAGYHYGPPVANLSAMPDRELAGLLGECHRRLLLRPAFIARHLARYGAFYLSNPRTLLRLARSGLRFIGAG